MKHLITVLFCSACMASMLACQQKSQVNASAKREDTVEISTSLKDSIEDAQEKYQPRLSPSMPYNLETDFKKYQTFDEFEVKGKGVAKSFPFVYVRASQDSIWVVNSDAKSYVHLYLRKGRGWFCHDEYRMDRIDENPIKSVQMIESLPARTYDRYLAGNKILELETFYAESIPWWRLFYIKSKTEVVRVAFYNDSYDLYDSDEETVKKILQLQELYQKGEFVDNLDKTTGEGITVSRFEIKYGNDYYKYILKENKENDGTEEYLYFPKNSLGLWGIQPGIDKRDYFKCSKQFEFAW